MSDTKAPELKLVEKESESKVPVAATPIEMLASIAVTVSELQRRLSTIEDGIAQNFQGIQTAFGTIGGEILAIKNKCGLNKAVDNVASGIVANGSEPKSGCCKGDGQTCDEPSAA